MFDGNTNLNGVFFAPGSSSVLVFGSVGTNQVQYGTASQSNDPYWDGKGFRSLDGDYAYHVWAGAVTIDSNTVPQKVLLGTVPEFEGASPVKKRAARAKTVFSKANTLRRLANPIRNPIRDRIRNEKDDGGSSSWTFGTAISS